MGTVVVRPPAEGGDSVYKRKSAFVLAAKKYRTKEGEGGGHESDDGEGDEDDTDGENFVQTVFIRDSWEGSEKGKEKVEDPQAKEEQPLSALRTLRGNANKRSSVRFSRPRRHHHLLPKKEATTTTASALISNVLNQWRRWATLSTTGISDLTEWKLFLVVVVLACVIGALLMMHHHFAGCRCTAGAQTPLRCPTPAETSRYPPPSTSSTKTAAAPAQYSTWDLIQSYIPKEVMSWRKAGAR